MGSQAKSYAKPKEVTVLEWVEDRRKNFNTYSELGVNFDLRIIFVSKEITADLARTFIKVFDELEAMDANAPITVRLMSEGGALAEAFAMYDRIRLSPCHVTTLATGFVASAATLILQAGDERLITETACLMIHNGSDAYEGAHNDFQRWANRAKVDRELMYKIYDRKSGRGTNFWESKCAVDTFLTSEESVELGLADRVLPALAL